MAVAPCPVLLASLGQLWWEIQDWEREETLTTRGTSPFPASTVGLALLGAALTVVAARGRRNWASLVLTLAWLLVAAGWYMATGETVDIGASGTTGRGLTLATWSLLPVTLASLLGSLTRSIEHRRARTGTPTR